MRFIVIYILLILNSCSESNSNSTSDQSSSKSLDESNGQLLQGTNFKQLKLNIIGEVSTLQESYQLCHESEPSSEFGDVVKTMDSESGEVRFEFCMGSLDSSSQIINISDSYEYSQFYLGIFTYEDENNPNRYTHEQLKWGIVSVSVYTEEDGDVTLDSQCWGLGTNWNSGKSNDLDSYVYKDGKVQEYFEDNDTYNDAAVCNKGIGKYLSLDNLNKVQIHLSTDEWAYLLLEDQL